MLQFARAVLGILCLVAAGTAVAVPTATLTFRDPTGTVGPTDSIDVWVRFTVAGTEPLQTDASGTVTSGIDPSDIPAGFTVTSSNVNNFFECTGTFTTVCLSGPPYDFTFNVGVNSFVGAQNLDLQPGNSYDFLFGTFTPDPSPAPAGTYVYFNVGFIIQMSDDTQNNPNTGSPPLEQDLIIADTCPNSDAACAFTRTVLSPAEAPEPGTLALLAVGLAGLGFFRRSKQS